MVQFKPTGIEHRRQDILILITGKRDEPLSLYFQYNYKYVILIVAEKHYFVN